MESLESLIEKWAEKERTYIMTIIKHRIGSPEEVTALRELEDARSAVLSLTGVERMGV